MKKILLFFKSGFKYIVFFILGIIVASSGVFAAVTITASNVNYDNSSSGLSSTNVQSAIDELNGKADIRKVLKFVAAYTYSTSSSNKCITGEELTCEKTTCYQQKTSGSCPAGTIVKYKVNDTTIMNFHVMFDNGSTMTMQSQRTIIYNVKWYEEGGNNTSGPINVLSALEDVTDGWSNVNNQTYTLGTTSFKTNAYTGCSTYNSCASNIYTLSARTGRARIISLQEAVALGCTSTSSSCPIWMYNYMSSSTSYSGTENDTGNGTNNKAYWTLQARDGGNLSAIWNIGTSGSVGSLSYANAVGARAVVVVSK